MNPDYSLNYYQLDAVSLGEFPVEKWDSYLPMKLASEAGEVAGKFGKAILNRNNVDPKAVALELGDVLWYVGVLAHHLGYTLSEIGEMNITKLNDRVDRGVVKGDGDNR